MGTWSLVRIHIAKPNLFGIEGTLLSQATKPEERSRIQANYN